MLNDPSDALERDTAIRLMGGRVYWLKRLAYPYHWLIWFVAVFIMIPAVIISWWLQIAYLERIAYGFMLLYVAIYMLPDWIQGAIIRLRQLAVHVRGVSSLET